MSLRDLRLLRPSPGSRNDLTHQILYYFASEELTLRLLDFYINLFIAE